MPFLFRLQKVLDYRQDEERLAAGELAKRRYERIKEEDILEKLKVENQELENFLRFQGQSRLSILSLIAAESCSCQLEKQMGQQRGKIHKACFQEEEQRKEVVAARRKTTVLEKLKEKKENDYIFQQKLTEQKKADEFSLYRHIYKKKEPGK